MERKGALLAVFGGEVVVGVAVKVDKTGLDATNICLELCGDDGEGGIRFFFKLGGTIRQNVQGLLIWELLSIARSEVRALPFGRLRDGGLRLICMCYGDSPGKQVDVHSFTWSGGNG